MTAGSRRISDDKEALRLLVERREALSRRRVQTVEALLADLPPGQANKDPTPVSQGDARLGRPRDIAGKTRRGNASQECAELVSVEARMKMANAERKAIVLARGSHLMDLHSVGITLVHPQFNEAN
jgi:hypothetical protein